MQKTYLTRVDGRLPFVCHSSVVRSAIFVAIAAATRASTSWRFSAPATVTGPCWGGGPTRNLSSKRCHPEDKCTYTYACFGEDMNSHDFHAFVYVTIGCWAECVWHCVCCPEMTLPSDCKLKRRNPTSEKILDKVGYRKRWPSSIVRRRFVVRSSQFSGGRQRSRNKPKQPLKDSRIDPEPTSKHSQIDHKSTLNRLRIDPENGHYGWYCFFGPCPPESTPRQGYSCGSLGSGDKAVLSIARSWDKPENSVCQVRAVLCTTRNLKRLHFILRSNLILLGPRPADLQKLRTFVTKVFKLMI